MSDEEWSPRWEPPLISSSDEAASLTVWVDGAGEVCFRLRVLKPGLSLRDVLAGLEAFLAGLLESRSWDHRARAPVINVVLGADGWQGPGHGPLNAPPDHPTQTVHWLIAAALRFVTDADTLAPRS